MSTLIKSIEPTFLLRSVDPAVLLQYYFSEDLDDIKLKRVSEAAAVSAVDSFKKVEDVDQRYENSSAEELYRFKDRSGVYRFVGTVNHKLFNIVNLSDYKVNLEKLKCLWCRQKIRLHPSEGSKGADQETEGAEWTKKNMFAPIGIPHKIEFMEDKTVVHTTDFFCSFECCYAELKKEKNVPQCNQNPIYCDSISLLLYVFRIFYPNDELKPAYPWRLHEKNGGFLSDKDFRKNNHVYKQLPNLQFCPAKIEYLVD